MKTRTTPLLSAAILALAAFANPAHAVSLTTTFLSDNGQSGNMFDVNVLGGPLTVTSLELNLDSGFGPIDLELYTKGGSHVGFEGNSGAWTLIDSITGVASAGADNPTFVDFADFVLPGTSTSAIYVTVTNGTTMNYTNGTNVGDVAAANADLEILEGVGKGYPFGSSFTTRIWNGTINYTVDRPSNGVPDSSSSILLLGMSLLAVAAGGHCKRRGKKGA